jgi:hypothetical protein
VYGDLNGLGTCVADGLVPIAPGATYACAFEGAVTGNAGELATDLVLAVLTDDDGNSAVEIAQEDVRIADVLPAVTLTKTPTPAVLPEPGGTVSFRVLVSNPSPEPVRVTSLVDDVYGDLSGRGSCVTPQTIQPGRTYTCSFPAPVTGNVGETATDTVTATAEDDDGNTTSDLASASVLLTPAAPRLSVTKTASPAAVPEPGGDVIYRVTVTNTSGTTDPITVESLSDTIGGVTSVPPGLACSVAGGSVSVPFPLAPGQSAVCTFPGRVEGNAGDAVLDTFRASGVDDEGAAASGAGSARVPVTDVPPTIVLGKTASPNPIDEPGGPVTYTATVRNASAETLTLTSLADDVEGDLDGVGTCDVPQAIVAGATYTCSWPGSVAGAADLETRKRGRTSAMMTSAWTDPTTAVPSSSRTRAVRMFERTSPASPETLPGHVQVYVAPAAIAWGTAQVPTPSRSPSTSSAREVSVRVSGEALRTVAMYVTGPPGSSMGLGEAVLPRTMVGGTSVTGTRAEPAPLAAAPSSSKPEALKVSRTASPALPSTRPGNVHTADCPGASGKGTLTEPPATLQPRPGGTEVTPPTVSLRDSTVMGSVLPEVFVTVTL